MSRLTDAFICMDSKIPTYGYMMHCGSTEYSNYPLFGDNHTSHEEGISFAPHKILPGHDITVTGMIHNADSVADYARTSQYKASSSSLVGSSPQIKRYEVSRKVLFSASSSIRMPRYWSIPCFPSTWLILDWAAGIPSKPGLNSQTDMATPAALKGTILTLTYQKLALCHSIYRNYC